MRLCYNRRVGPFQTGLSRKVGSWKELTQQDQSICPSWMLQIELLGLDSGGPRVHYMTYFSETIQKMGTDISPLVGGLSCVGLRVTTRSPLVLLYRPRLLLLSTFAGLTDSCGGGGAPNVVWKTNKKNEPASFSLGRTGTIFDFPHLRIYFLSFFFFFSCAVFVPD